MNAVTLAALWAALGVSSVLLTRPLGRRRYGLAVTMAMAVTAAVAAASATAHAGGPFSAGTGFAFILTRPGAAMLAAGSVALTLCRLDGGPPGSPATTAFAGAAAVLIESAAQPLAWGLALLAAMATLGLRWVASAPGRGSFAAPRIAVTGAFVAVAVAPFYPVPGGADRDWPELVGWFAGAALVIVLASPPLGGWAVSAWRAVRGAEVAPWILLVAPAIALSALPIPASLPLISARIVQQILVATGLAGVLVGGALAAAGPRQERFARIALADLGMVAAAIGGKGDDREAAVALVIAGILLASPLLLTETTPLPRWMRAIAWGSLSGLAPGLSLWGRLLVLEIIASSGPFALTVAVVGGGLIAVACIREILALTTTGAVFPRAAIGQWMVGAAVAAGLILAAVVPALVTHGLLGV